MSGAMWPGAELMLAQAGARHGIPYAMSTMATRPPEDLQRPSGRSGLVPALSARRPGHARRPAGADPRCRLPHPDPDRRRAGQFAARTAEPRRPDPSAADHPAHAFPHRCRARPGRWAQCASGMPRMRVIEKYSDHKGPLPSTAHIGYLLRIAPDWSYVTMLRQEWQGRFVVKGVLRSRGRHPAEGRRRRCGLDLEPRRPPVRRRPRRHRQRRTDPRRGRPRLSADLRFQASRAGWTSCAPSPWAPIS